MRLGRGVIFDARGHGVVLSLRIPRDGNVRSPVGEEVSHGNGPAPRDEGQVLVHFHVSFLPVISTDMDLHRLTS